MIINLKIKEDRVIGYRNFPIYLNIEYVEVDEIPLDILSGRYTYKNHKLIDMDELKSETNQQQSPNLYDKKSALEAFEKYKNDVLYGIILEDEETHVKILNWYKDIIKNEEIDNTPPKEILKYLEEK